MTIPAADLPDHREQSPEVAARFSRLKSRPVVLRADGLEKVYSSAKGPVIALQGFGFEVFRRELMCVIGPSGCGKSTLVRILAGLESPTAGHVFVDGKPVDGPGRDRGMVFQGYTLFPWLTVKQNVMFGPRMTGASPLAAEAEARQWIDLVGLGKFEDSYPRELSGGMKQRVAIARALANQPRVLLMDEPFGALDAQTRAHMQHHLLQIWRNVDVTIVFITHDLDEAVFLADRILVLAPNPGRVDEIVEVPVPHPREPGQTLTPAFLATRAYIEERIRLPADRLSSEQPMPRLTRVDDSVD